VGSVLAMLPHPELAETWRTARPEPDLLHLDSAAAGRSSRSVLSAVTAHLEREARTGGYVAAALAAPELDRARADLAGLLGHAPEDTVLTESAVSALSALLEAWRLPPGSAVLVSPGEYGPNLALFARWGLVVEPMDTADAVGHVDLDALRTRLAARPPALVHLCHLGSHRGVVQPAAEVVDLARGAGVPVVVDAAQALGHVDTALGADAVYATSRKWLAGPRGVGVLAVRPGLLDVPTAGLESAEAFVAGRIGLGVALAEHLALDPSRVHTALAARGRATREALDGTAGWRTVEPVDEPSATTTLAPPVGWTDAQVETAQQQLLVEHRVLVTLAGPWRAPLEAAGTVLRVSPHLDATAEDLDRLARALAAVS
jgi:pyridoxal 5-phosphate dependent beta-lyase